MVLMERRLHWSPPALPVDAPPTMFSEERAMAHVVKLAGELPDRQVCAGEVPWVCASQGGQW